MNTAVGYQTLYHSTGDSNTAIGTNAGLTTTGNAGVYLGYYAGAYETGDDAFYVDDRDRSNTAGDKAKALMYGVFATAAANQTLTINAGVTISSLAGTGSRAVNASATGVLSAASDARMKENIIPLTGRLYVMALLKNEDIHAIYYDWKDKTRGAGTEIGMTYQMWKDVVPEIAGTEGADQHGYLDYQKLTVILWEQNKILLKRIEELEKKYE